MIDKAAYWREWRAKKQGKEREAFLEKGRRRYHRNKETILAQKKEYYLSNRDRIINNVNAYNQNLKRQLLEDAFERVVDARDGFDVIRNKAGKPLGFGFKEIGKKSRETRHKRRQDSGYYQTKGYKETVEKYRTKHKEDYRQYHRNRYYINRTTVMVANIILLSNLHPFMFKVGKN